MDFELTEDHLELQRVVRDIAERECPPTLVRSVVEGVSDGTDLWKTYVGLDWPSLTIAEDDGGMGFTAVELVLVLEELGRVADPTPFLATTSQYAPLVREVADDDTRGRLLGAVAAGSTGAVAFAADEVRAEPAADGSGSWTLAGTARHVLDGDRADHVAVVATTPDGPGVFVVPAAEAGATRTPAFDGTLHVADLALDGTAVPAERCFVGPSIGDAVARARHVALAGLAATTVGACQRILELALAHLQDRKQFGVPLGAFQALKHMAVDVYMAIERARALVHFAGLTIAEDDPRRAIAASMAKAAAGEAQRLTARHGIQFFGGLGFTWENDLQLYVRRAKAGDPLLGSAAEHRAIVAQATLQELAR